MLFADQITSGLLVKVDYRTANKYFGSGGFVRSMCMNKLGEVLGILSNGKVKVWFPELNSTLDYLLPNHLSYWKCNDET